MKLYIVGQTSKDSWELVGVFDSEDLALKNCLDPAYFIGPIELNESIHDYGSIWAGAYYPIAINK